MDLMFRMPSKTYSYNLHSRSENTFYVIIQVLDNDYEKRLNCQKLYDMLLILKNLTITFGTLD